MGGSCFSIRCLNPYSTGSNSNMYDIYQNSKQYLSLNPYSTGSNSNPFPGWRGLRKFRSLNPYSTGSNSNNLIINNLFFTLCFVYFS